MTLTSPGSALLMTYSVPRLPAVPLGSMTPLFSKREPPFPCNELWVLFSCSVIPSGSCHQKFLTISALLTIPVLSSNTAAKVLLISIDLWSFSGFWETQLNTEAEMINFA